MHMKQLNHLVETFGGDWLGLLHAFMHVQTIITPIKQGAHGNSPSDDRDN